MPAPSRQLLGQSMRQVGRAEQFDSKHVKEITVVVKCHYLFTCFRYLVMIYSQLLTESYQSERQNFGSSLGSFDESGHSQTENPRIDCY